jgi:hypothetical protein
MNEEAEKYGQISLPDNSRIGLTQVTFNKPITPKEKPSFGETLGANVRQFNDVVRGGEWLWNTFTNPLYDIEDDYDPIKEGFLDQVHPQDRARLLDTSSLREGQSMVRAIHQEYNDKDIRDRSGWFANLTTSLAAGIASPTTLIPIAQTIKYGTIGKGFFQNALNTVKTLTPAIALQNAILAGTKQTEGWSEWAHDTIVESFLGAGLGGAVGAFAAKGIGNRLTKVNTFFDAVKDDVGIGYKLGEKIEGEVVHFRAYPLHNDVSAAAVDQVQHILDTIKPLENNPMTKKFFAWSHPIIEGLTSPYAAVRDLTNSLFAHNFGDYKPAVEELKRSWRSQYESVLLEQKKDWLEEIGVKGDFFSETKAVAGEWAGKFKSHREFSEEVGKSIRRNGEAGSAPVQRAAKRWIKEFYDPLWDELKKRRSDLSEHEFSNIKRYLNRIYDKALIQQDPNGFLGELGTYLTKRNSQLQELRAPLDAMKAESQTFRAQMAELRKDKASALGKADKRAVQSKIDRLKLSRADNKARIDAYWKDLEERMFKGEIDINLMADRPNVKPEEAVKIMEFNEQEAVLKAQVKEAEKLHRSFGSKGKKTPETLKRQRDAKKNLETKQQQLKTHKERIQEFINTGKLDPSATYITKAGERRLKRLNKPKIAKTMSSEEIRQSAQRTMDTVLQQNEEQLVGQMFNGIAERNPNVLHERSVLWNDEQAERWLVNDMNVLGGVYMDQMVNRIHLDDVLLRYGATPEEGKKGVANMLKGQYDQQRAELIKLERTPEVQKKLDKLDKGYEKSKDFIEKMYKVTLGDFGDKSSVSFRVTNSLKELAVSTLLGNLPILELTEFFTPLFKYTMNEYINDGLIPMLRYWNELRRTGKVDRAAFQDVGIGNNVALGKRIQAMFGYGAQGQPKTMVERYIKNMANISNNISMANHITDFQETMVAFMSQAKTVRLLEGLEKGEQLTAKDMTRFGEIRFDPHKYGKTVLEQIKKHGEQFEGGWVANWHLWDKEAFEAQQAFKISIEKDCRALITKPNALDMPFAFKDNIIMSLATQFLSFPFSATLNFTIPTLTKPDAQKFIGMLTTMAAASMVGPLRQLAKGEEVNLDPEALAAGAFTDSGFFGWHFDALQRLNSAFDLPFMRPFQNDRFRKKDFWSLLGGPSTGILADVGNTLSAIVNGDLTQRDAGKILRYTLPFTGSWYLRQPVDAMIESWGLPESREPRG